MDTQVFFVRKKHCAWQLAFALGELAKDTSPKVRTCWLIQSSWKWKLIGFHPDFFLKTHYFHLHTSFFRERLICLDSSGNSLYEWTGLASKFLIMVTPLLFVQNSYIYSLDSELRAPCKTFKNKSSLVASESRTVSFSFLNACWRHQV